MSRRMKPATTPASPYTSTSLWQSQEATANQIEAMQPDAVALLGDLQYQVGQYQDFEQSFDLTYGAFKFLIGPPPATTSFITNMVRRALPATATSPTTTASRSMPTGTRSRLRSRTRAHQRRRGAATRALPPPLPAPNPCRDRMDRRGTSSKRAESEPPYRRGAQSESEMAGTPIMWAPGTLSRSISSARHSRAAARPPAPGLPPKLEWLKKDLEENHSACTAAYWHQPTFSAADSITEEGITAGTFWQLLYEHEPTWC